MEKRPQLLRSSSFVFKHRSLSVKLVAEENRAKSSYLEEKRQMLRFFRHWRRHPYNVSCSSSGTKKTQFVTGLSYMNGRQNRVFLSHVLPHGKSSGVCSSKKPRLETCFSHFPSRNKRVARGQKKKHGAKRLAHNLLYLLNHIKVSRSNSPFF